MNKRPLSVAVVGWLYVVVGAVGFAYHASEIDRRHPYQSDILWVELIRLTAIVSGVFVLLGRNWARWLALAWIAYHVILSAFHTAGQLAIHLLFCVILGYLLFRPAAARYFRGTGNTEGII